MPTVLVRDGFRVVVLLPPREHGPPHVHVHRAGGTAVIGLPHRHRPVSVRKVARMSDADVVKAVRLVEENTELLLRAWRRYHD